jgi:hypothetical protein
VVNVSTVYLLNVFVAPASMVHVTEGEISIAVLAENFGV